jgi:hypothetical protein
MHDIVNNVGVALAKASAQVTASGTGIILDTKGFHSLAYLITFAAVAAADADNTLAFAAEEGDSALGYDFVAVPTERLINAYTLNSTATAQSVQKFGVIPGIKRYMRVKYTETGTVDTTFSVTLLKGNPEERPVA